jgi:hypothetical protein
MGFVRRFTDNAKKVPLTVWFAGVLIPGGLTAISLYTAYKATKIEEIEQPLDEFVREYLKKESETNNDKG